jgi:uncharacterized protein (DUF934 family)
MSDVMDTVRVDHRGHFMAEPEERAQRADKQVSEVSSLSVLDAWLAEPVIALVVASFSDGRVFTLARQLRQIGFTGRLEVVGDLLPDQLPMLLEAGVDVLEISTHHARRCDEAQWAGKAAQWADQAAQQGRFGYQHHNGRTVSATGRLSGGPR